MYVNPNVFSYFHTVTDVENISSLEHNKDGAEGWPSSLNPKV